MRRLRLDPDALRVESFETTGEDGAPRGTVRGLAAEAATPEGPTPTVEPTGCTCITVCNDTCVTIGCDDTCRLSCPECPSILTGGVVICCFIPIPP